MAVAIQTELQNVEASGTDGEKRSTESNEDATTTSPEAPPKTKSKKIDEDEWYGRLILPSFLHIKLCRIEP